MAFTWQQKKATLRAVFAAALKLDVPDNTTLLADGTFLNADSEAIQWENERGDSRITNGIWCDLRLGSVVSIGEDEIRRSYDSGTDRLLPTYGGPRRFSVMVIVASDDQESTEAIGEVAGRLRTRLMREELLQQLMDCDLGFTKLGATMNIDYQDDGRMYSQSMTEVWFETNEQDEPTSSDSGDYVKEVHGGGTLATGHDLVDIQTTLNVVVP